MSTRNSRSGMKTRSGGKNGFVDDNPLLMRGDTLRKVGKVRRYQVGSMLIRKPGGD